jgi:DNA-binding Xre family transcriptional regulator
VEWVRGKFMIKLKVGDLLRQKGMNATELMRDGKISYVTALRLSKGKGTAISFEVLDCLCKLFDVGVGEIMEYVPSEPNAKG